ncbi:MAG: hypothetical protein FJ267_05065 [Planctomycetes bacterium]|nr:hypothetical protein [Planctomycetota bacterium]
MNLTIRFGVISLALILMVSLVGCLSLSFGGKHQLDGNNHDTEMRIQSLESRLQSLEQRLGPGTPQHMQMQ